MVSNEIAMARSTLCLMLSSLISAPGFIIAMLSPGTLTRVVPEGLIDAWIVVVFILMLAGAAFWKADGE